MSMKAEANGKRFNLAFLIRVDNTKTASKVERVLLNPNCSSPISPWSSDMLVIRLHILTVRTRSKFEGIVIGRYWAGERESPP